MKKLKLDLSKFSKEEILSREELRRVLGGVTQSSTSDGSCSITQTCWNGSVSCSGEGGNCSYVKSPEGLSGVQCDDDEAIYCSKQEVELV